MALLVLMIFIVFPWINPAIESILSNQLKKRTHVLSTRPGKRVKLQIWDTAGQERFQTITQQQDSQTGGSPDIVRFVRWNRRSGKKIRRNSWIH